MDIKVLEVTYNVIWVIVDKLKKRKQKKEFKSTLIKKGIKYIFYNKILKQKDQATSWTSRD